MLIVGLAGGIATGKSLVAQEAAKLPGVAVADADKIAWETYAQGTEVYQKLVARFGQSILTSEGAIDRKKLGALIFSDPQARDYLNSIVHPAVRKKLTEVAQEHRARGTKLLVIEAALLLESPYANKNFFQYVILVHASREAQIERLMKRNGLSYEEARTRVEARTPSEQLIPLADFVIDASETIEKTLEQTREIFRSLLARA
jgi:dephospho-CoA kinase